MDQGISLERLVFIYPDGSVGEDVRLDFGFSTYSNLTEKTIKGRTFLCPLLLTGAHVHKKCNSAHHHKGGYLLRHLTGKDHPGVPSTWKTFWKVET